MQSRVVREQLLALGVALLVIPWWYVWGPASPDWRRNARILLPIAAGVWLACQIVFLVRRVSVRGPVARTKLGKFTMIAGLVSALSLFTGFLLGWMALLLAPAGIVTGLIVLVREFRAHGGNDVRNLAGMAMCAGAIVFLMA